jgi:hypothetical protein
VGGYGADSGFFIFAHEATVTFDIGTENCGELTLKFFCSHVDISCKSWRRQGNERSELEQEKGRTGSNMVT